MENLYRLSTLSSEGRRIKISPHFSNCGMRTNPWKIDGRKGDGSIGSFLRKRGNGDGFSVRHLDGELSPFFAFEEFREKAESYPVFSFYNFLR